MLQFSTFIFCARWNAVKRVLVWLTGRMLGLTYYWRRWYIQRGINLHVERMEISRGKADVRWWAVDAARMRGARWMQSLEEIRKLRLNLTPRGTTSWLGAVLRKREVGCAILAPAAPVSWTTEGGDWRWWKSEEGGRAASRSQPASESHSTGTGAAASGGTAAPEHWRIIPHGRCVQRTPSSTWARSSPTRAREAAAHCTPVTSRFLWDKPSPIRRGVRGENQPVIPSTANQASRPFSRAPVSLRLTKGSVSASCLWMLPRGCRTWHYPAARHAKRTVFPLQPSEHISTPWARLRGCCLS